MDAAATAKSLPVDSGFVDRFCRRQVREEESRRLVCGDPELATFTLLAIQQRIAGNDDDAGAHTPSAAVPPYAKPAARTNRARRNRARRN